MLTSGINRKHVIPATLTVARPPVPGGWFCVFLKPLISRDFHAKTDSKIYSEWCQKLKKTSRELQLCGWTRLVEEGGRRGAVDWLEPYGCDTSDKHPFEKKSISLARHEEARGGRGRRRRRQRQRQRQRTASASTPVGPE